CSTCSKCFTQMSNLQSHQRQHMKGKPHRCEQCFMSFDLRDELEEHVQAKHSGNRYSKVLVCPMCQKSYNSETYLAKHLDRHREAMVNGTPFPSSSNRGAKSLEHMSSMLSAGNHSGVPNFDTYSSMRNNSSLIPLSAGLPHSALLSSVSSSNSSELGLASAAAVKLESPSTSTHDTHNLHDTLDLVGGHSNYDLNGSAMSQQVPSSSGDIMTSFQSGNDAISRERLAAVARVAVAFNNSHRKIMKPEPQNDNLTSSSESFSRSLDFFLQASSNHRRLNILDEPGVQDFIVPPPDGMHGSLMGHGTAGELNGEYSFDELLRKAAQMNQGGNPNVYGQGITQQQCQNSANQLMRKYAGNFGQGELEKKPNGGSGTELEFEDSRERNSLTA
ncbi:hypothetical protein Ciccas_009551, partial [Cichlidogyrus casuarinus]